MNVDAVSQCESYYQGHFLHSVQCSIIKRNKGKIKMKKSGIFYVFHLYLVILTPGVSRHCHTDSICCFSYAK